MSNKTVITVRDRRKSTQFIVDNIIMDHWYPIIGEYGYALYNFYCRMANAKDEKCFPGYTLIQSHLKIGRTSISNYNKLLRWCDLIYIDSGSATKSNTYYLLEVQKVTPKRLETIRQRAIYELSSESTFLERTLRAIDGWEPLQAHWSGGSRKKVVAVHPAQTSLFDEGGSPPREHPSPPREHPSPPREQGVRAQDSNKNKATKRSNKKNEQKEAEVAAASPNGATPDSAAAAGPGEEKLTQLLKKAGIGEPTLSEIAALPHVTIGYAAAHIRKIEKDGDSIGLLIHRLREGDPAPARRRPLTQEIPDDLKHIIKR
jgi:hypothetical protein